MKMKLKTIVSDNFTESFNNLCSLRTIPASTLFILKGMRKKLNEEVSKFNELRTEYIKEYAERDENNNIVYVKENVIRLRDSLACNNKIQELENTEIDVQELKFSSLGENPALSTNDLCNLEFIVE